MSGRRTKSSSTVVTDGALGHDPLGSDALLERTFYKSAALPAPVKAPKPTHYKIVSISLYQQDIERLEAMVAELKRRGHTKANKSQLIRFALDTVDIDRLPKSY